MKFIASVIILGAAILSLEILAAEPAAVDPWPRDPAAQELLDRSYENLYGGDFIQMIRMTTRGRAGITVTRRMQIVRKESEPPGRAMVRFLSPEEERGTSMLVIERRERTDDIFVYLPALARTRRVASGQRYDSFFGTTFTYEDLEPKHAEDFEARALGHLEIDGIRCTKVRVEPRPGVASRYDHTISCIEPERAVALWTEYYRDGRLLKRLEADPARIREFDGHFIPMLLRLSDESTDFTTEIATESWDARAVIPERLFSMVNLETGDEQSDLRLSGPASDDAP